MGSSRKNSKLQKEAVKYAKSHKKAVIITVCVILVIVIAAIAILYVVKPEIFKNLFGGGSEDGLDGQGGNNHVADEDSGGQGGNNHIAAGELTEISSAGLSIHFIKFDNDKAGDSTLIKCGDTEILIDAGSTQSSATTIKTYIDQYVTDGKLEYVIATHADQDHIAGLVGTSSKNTYNGILYSYEIGTIIRFDRTQKSLTTPSGGDTLYAKFEKAVDYAVSQGAKEYTGLQCYNQTDGASRTYYLDAQNKISMNILYNYYYDHDDYSKSGNITTDENDYSVCMLLKQEISAGQFKNYLFTGDLEESGEEYLVQYNELPEVELFKAGHHGSPTSSNDCLLSVIKPKYVAVCCCAGTDEYTDNTENQFPSQAFVDRVSKYTDCVYVTNMISANEAGYEPMNGNIVFYVSGTELKLWCSQNTTKLKDTEWFKNNRTCPSYWA